MVVITQYIGDIGTHWGNIGAIMENHLEKTIENEMQTGSI